MLPNVLSDGALMIKLFPEQHNITFRGQMTTKDAEAGSEDGCTLYCWLVFPCQGQINGEEDDPDDYKQQHTDGDQRSIFVQIWQLSTFECKQETNKAQESVVH